MPAESMSNSDGSAEAQTGFHFRTQAGGLPESHQQELARLETAAFQDRGVRPPHRPGIGSRDEEAGIVLLRSR